jgi:Icc-related predicted phosphoesterase
MRLLYVTDLHGCEAKYSAALAAARRAGVAAVINGGDMLPHARNLHSQGEFLTGFLDRHLAECASAGLAFLGLLGNDDLRIFDGLFSETLARHGACDLAQRRVTLGGFEFIGCNWVCDYPFRLKDRCRMDSRQYIFQPQLGPGRLSRPDGWEGLPDWPAYARALPTLRDELEKLPAPDDPSRAVYVIHMPPAGLGLDCCATGQEVGSKAVREFLLARRPLVSLHGHIHESPAVSGVWRARLGPTLCIQPGQFGKFAFVILDLETGAAERIEE